MARRSEQDWRRFGATGTPGTVALDDDFFAATRPGARVLDVGCAWGRVSLQLARWGYRVVGVDVNAEAARRGQAEGAGAHGRRPSFLVASALELPFADGAFDAAVMLALLTTLVDPAARRRVVDEAHRVLRPGGALYVGAFGRTWSNPVYRRRYEDHLAETGELGTFVVTDDGKPDSPEAYRAHHYTEAELRGLLSPAFRLTAFRRTTFRSYHGNEATGYVIAGRALPGGQPA